MIFMIMRFRVPSMATIDVRWLLTLITDGSLSPLFGIRIADR